MRLHNTDHRGDHHRDMDRVVLDEHVGLMGTTVLTAWPSEPNESLADMYTEFTITTDPAEAPADALLEAAGYYVEPGDKPAVAAMYGDNRLVWHRTRDEKGAKVRAWTSELAKMAWDPYSWDVPRPWPPPAHIPSLGEPVTASLLDQANTAEASWFNAIVWYGGARSGKTETVAAQRKAEAVRACTRCNGTGRVAGALGVGIEWPCECVGGAG